MARRTPPTPVENPSLEDFNDSQDESKEDATEAPEDVTGSSANRNDTHDDTEDDAKGTLLCNDVVYVVLV